MTEGRSTVQDWKIHERLKFLRSISGTHLEESKTLKMFWNVEIMEVIAQ